MLKINLSDGEGKNHEESNLEEMIEDEALEEMVASEELGESAPDKDVPEESETMADMLGDVAESEEPAEPPKPVKPAKSAKPEKKKKTAGKSGAVIKVAALVFLVIAVAAAILTQRNTIMSLFVKKEAPAPEPPPPPPPAPEPVRTEPDPTFVTLSRISEIVPAKVWLSSATISSDGAYEITGMSFSHDALELLTASLGSIGQIGSQDIPAKTKSSEAVYLFTVAGGLSGVSSPEILDIIPSDDLAAIAKPVIDRSDDFGIVFKIVPEAGKPYTEHDLPFMLEGSFEGLKKVIGELCPQDGQIRVHRLVIKPASGGRIFDRVQASFSLRTISSI